VITTTRDHDVGSLFVNGVYGKDGDAAGLAVFNGVKRGVVRQVKVSGVEAGDSSSAALNGCPQEYYVFTGDGVDEVSFFEMKY